MNTPVRTPLKDSGFVKKLEKLYSEHYMISLIILAHVLNFVIEILARHSLIGAFKFLFANPLIFEYSVLIILLTFSISLFCKRKPLALSLSIFVWLMLGVINFILLFFRITPLAATDFQLLASVRDIIGRYLDWWQIILIAIGIIFLIVLFAAMAVNAKKTPRNFLTAVCLSSLSALILIFGTVFGSARGMLPEQFENLPSGYDEYGFVYCFCVSIFDRGIDEPENYSAAEIDDILSDIGRQSHIPAAARPNVIFLQLESFFDPAYLKDIITLQNPTPVFSRLKENYPSGFLTVPSVGAGTANTEFEIITGMNIDYFGTGEYPYKTILDYVTCETINYNLKELGYTCHAIHNHNGSFYGRNEVYRNLGFDTFTSLEYMNGVQYNEIGWAKDYVLTPQILKALYSTPGQDMIYAVSVQAHGKYPTIPLTGPTTIDALGFSTQEEKTQWEYYFTQLYETDLFIGTLIHALQRMDEDTVLVLCGDHLPNLDLENEDLTNGDVFQTEYVIWSNFEMDDTERDLYSYQLSAYVMERLGFDNGVLTKLHQNYSGNPNYQQAMELIEYDVLYGELETHDGENPYEPTDMKMGLDDIEIDGVYFLGDTMYVTGRNFNEWSVIFVDEEKLETVFISDGVLLTEFPEPEEPVFAEVCQVGKDGKPLSESEGFVFQPDSMIQFG